MVLHEKKSKKKEEKKRKLKIEEIQVLFETGTGGQCGPFVPTTSSHADSQTLTPKLLSLEEDHSGQEALWQERKIPAIPARRKTKVPTLPDESQEFIEKLNEIIKQLTATEASMENDDKRRRLHPLWEKKTTSPVTQNEETSSTDRQACNSATNISSLQGATSRLLKNMQQEQRNGSLQYDSSCQWNSRLESLLTKCLSVFKRDGAPASTPSDVQLVEEIREMLSTDFAKPVDEPKTQTRTPEELLNLNLDSWDDVIARRIKERKKSPSDYGKQLFSKEAVVNRLNQSKLHDNGTCNSLAQSNYAVDDVGTSLDQSEDEIFVTPASSLTSIHEVLSSSSSETLLNTPPMELLEWHRRTTGKGQQTEVLSMSSEYQWNDVNTCFNVALATDSTNGPTTRPLL